MLRLLKPFIWLVTFDKNKVDLEVVDFTRVNHRNLSKHRLVEHNMLSWIKQQSKLIRRGAMTLRHIEIGEVGASAFFCCILQQNLAVK